MKETKNEKSEILDKPKTYRFSFSEKDLEMMEINKSNKKEIETEIRQKLNLPEKIKNTKRAIILQKLGLDTKATQKQIFEKIEQQLNKGE